MGLWRQTETAGELGRRQGRLGRTPKARKCQGVVRAKGAGCGLWGEVFHSHWKEVWGGQFKKVGLPNVVLDAFCASFLRCVSAELAQSILRLLERQCTRPFCVEIVRVLPITRELHKEDVRKFENQSTGPKVKMVFLREPASTLSLVRDKSVLRISS